MEPITVKYKVLDTRAKVPSYATPGSAAADLCAVLDAPLTLAPMERALVPTGLAIELPGPHAVALVYARSGLSIKHGLCMANGVGVVDSDYRGELKVPMVNLGREAYTIQPGERVAQLCKECGLTLTGAGSAYPYHKDPQDSHLRIAPTYPSLDEVETASDLLCVCVKLAVIEKLLAEKAE